MTRPVPEDRVPTDYEMDWVSGAMDGYIQCAAEAVKDHGNTITDTHPHVLAAGFMVGCAVMHAAERFSLVEDRKAAAMDRLADAIREAALMGGGWK